ncbi:hypothetical protein JCM33374_g3539 [Metschnikowia sp. JCM 33374]|nr:hypothetical protein JCM33374_g3539 [Metschnikowia sp. JCM 33374]
MRFFSSHPKIPCSSVIFSCLLLLASLALASESSIVENTSYKNLNPRPYDNCEANDLIKLSACCNDVLADLDDCKAGDLACECCALQSMDSACYSLCPGNPSTNFLAVLFDDCSSLNDVNACNIPFKRVDGDRPASFRNRKANVDAIQRASSTVKTQMSSEKDKDKHAEKASIDKLLNPDGAEVQKQKPKINLIGNDSNTGMLC